MLAGLQGTGKTTATIKLANFIKNKYSRKTSVIAADIYRPAASIQLNDLAKQSSIEVFSASGKKPLEIVLEGEKVEDLDIDWSSD
jgi:signal recognition particle subunit SRP54